MMGRPWKWVNFEMALSGNLGLVVPEEVGAGDLPMVALSDDVID